MPTTTSFLLETPTPSGAVTAPTTAAPNVPTGLQPFLGFGLRRPFRRDGKGDFLTAGEVELVRSAIGQVLGTRASDEVHAGELPWRPEFGSLLHLLRHRKNRFTLQELGRAYIQDALSKWEPRIKVTTVQVVEQTDRKLDLRCIFDLIDENVPGNGVILSGLEVTVPVTT